MSTPSDDRAQGTLQLMQASPCGPASQAQMQALNKRFGALREWRNCDTSAGPLKGIRTTVKDNIGVSGMQTWAGSCCALPEQWAQSGSLIQRLESLGAAVNSKSHCAEFAFGGSGFNPQQGTPINPWSAHGVPLAPGGSSSGTAVAVACGQAQLGVGTDTGGSVRVPAALCGCVGYRATPGHWPMDGVLPLVARVDAYGLITPRVNDLARVVSAIDDVASVEALSAQALKVAQWPMDALGDCDPDRSACYREATERLRGMGATVVDADRSVLDRAFDVLNGGPNTAAVEFSRFLNAELSTWRHRLNPHVDNLITEHESVSDTALNARVVELEGLHAQIEQLFANSELIISPATGLAPPPISHLSDPAQYHFYSNALLHFTVLGSLFGCCGISIPAGLDSDGLPMSIQLLARPGDDLLLLRAALLLEHTLPPIPPPSRFLQP